MAGRTIVFHTCPGVWSEKLAIIPLGGLAIPFRRVIYKSELFLSLFSRVRSKLVFAEGFFCLNNFYITASQYAVEAI